MCALTVPGKKRAPSASSSLPIPNLQKEKKKKRKRDPTGNRSIESLYGELVSKQIVKKIPFVQLKDFIGVHHTSTSQLDGKLKGSASLAEVRRVGSILISVNVDR